MEATTETPKPQVATIKEYVYEFTAKDRAPLELNKKSKIFLVINDLETSIAIESLFIGKIDFDDEDICGYSILQLITGGTQLKIDENTILKITFIDKTTGREFYISKIRRSLMYDDDMEISTESRLRYIDLLLTTSMIPVEAKRVEEEAEKEAAENERKRLEEEERLRVEAEQEAAENEKKKLEEDERLIVEAERLRVEAAEASIIGGKLWKGQRNDLIKSGHTEYAFGEYKMFYKKSEDNEPAEIGFFVLSPGNYEFIELYEEEITDEMEEYSFEDDNEDHARLVFDKIANKISVEK